MFPINPNGWATPRKDQKKPNAKKKVEEKTTTTTKRAQNSTYLIEVLVYRATIREPTPRVVSNLLIVSLQKLPVFYQRLQAIASNMF